MKRTTFAEAFPSELALDAGPVMQALAGFSHIDHGSFEVAVLGEVLHIPNRVYSPGRSAHLAGLSPLQRQMALCLLTRSTDGFQRQAALRDVIAINMPWSVPFVVALVGDYVVEILDDIDAALPQMQNPVVGRFIADNPVFYRLTRARVASYWSCYYRWPFPRRDYVGFRLLKALDALGRTASSVG